MYRAQYPLQSTGSGVLSFTTGDQFTVMERPNDNWWLVQNGRGEMGYVPANYLVADEAAHADVLLSIDRAIQVAEQHVSEAGKNCSKELKSNLRKLNAHRENVIAEHQQVVSQVSTKRRAPTAPQPDNSQRNTTFTDGATSPRLQKPRAPPPPPPSTVHCSTPSLPTGLHHSPISETTVSFEIIRSPPTDTSGSSLPSMVEAVPPEGLGMEMVEKMRCCTALSYDKSKVAVATVLSLLAERIPSTRAMVDTILEGIAHAHTSGSGNQESNDAVRLSRLFTELESVKDDSQQRSWCLHEDEQTICQHLEDLSSILTLANPVTCREVLVSTGYTVCHNLVLYYQMETRVSIRLLLLQAFGSMCALDMKVISELLNSVLPLELARDIQNDLSDIQKLTYSALVLTMIFSTGEAVPLQYYDHLNVKFVEFLLDNIETPPPNDDAEMVPDVFVKLILAFNLHFELPDENLIMTTIAGRGTAKTLTEKLMLLFNRADDPVRMFDHLTNSPNSVIKFFSDVYSCKQTANLLYTNDAKVLIDIIVRQLNDLSRGDKMRTDYLSLMQLLLANSDYEEHCHRQSELQSCFNRIGHEDGGEGTTIDMDQMIVQQIWKQFPQFFQDTF
jgi:hypothetical protein